MDPELVLLTLLLMMVGGFTLLLLQIAGMWQVFVKANRPGWYALIPFYNIYALVVEVARAEQWRFWVIFAQLPVSLVIGVVAALVGTAAEIDPLVINLASSLVSGVVNAFVWLPAWIPLAAAFGRGPGFAYGMGLLPYFFFPILGFSEDRYKKPKRKKKVIEEEEEDDYDDDDYDDDEEDDPRPRRRRSAR